MLVNPNKSALITDNYSNNLSISNQSVPLEIVNKIASYMRPGTKIHFKRTSQLCDKATQLTKADEEIINLAKREFQAFKYNKTRKDTGNNLWTDNSAWKVESQIGHLCFLIPHGFYPIDKAKDYFDQIFIKNPVTYSSPELIHIYLSKFYTYLGFEYVDQYNQMAAEACFLQALKASAKESNLIELANTLLNKHSKNN